MDQVILIKYGELTTKKGNRKFFINTLHNNIKNKLSNYEIKINKEHSRMYIFFKGEDLDNIINDIGDIFGIHMYHVATVVPSEEEKINEKVLEIAKDTKFNTFKIETKRSDKKFPIASMDFSRNLGGVLLKNINNIKVEVINPEVLIKVEIREENTYIYTENYKGIGGYPVGTQPKGLLMLSGGIDSPVAGYLTLKRGVTVEAVYFEALPHTSLNARNKVIKLSEKLKKYAPKFKLHVVNFTPIQEEIYQKCNETYCITIMRRMMYRIMEEIAKREKGFVIINGESIGQVASQTLSSMSVINEVTSMPIIRPVSCLDKVEIIDIAKKIDTYETSILPFEDCCTVFVPKHPVINPKLDIAIKEEEKIEYKELIDKAVNSIKVIDIKTELDSEIKDLL